MSFIQPQSRYRLHPEPRLSANQLAEYLDATPTRRKTIVRDAKFVKTSVVAQLREARQAIGRLLTHPASRAETVADAQRRLGAREADPGATDWARQDCKGSLDAIETFQALFGDNKLGLGQWSFRPISDTPLLPLAGVALSVNFVATVHKTGRGGKEHVGGIAMTLGRSEANIQTQRNRGKAVGVMCHLFSDRFLGHLGTADPDLCFLMNVFAGEIYRAPMRHKKLLADMQMACEEVVLRWPGAEPPIDYDGPSP